MRQLTSKAGKPGNYGRRYHGRVPLAVAFAESLNAATVRLSQQVGIDEVVAAAHDLGLRAQLPRLPSIALGTADVTLIDLTSAYDAVRAGVTPIEAYGITGIQTASNGQLAPVGPPDVKQHALGAYRDPLITPLRGVIVARHRPRRGPVRLCRRQDRHVPKLSRRPVYRL